MFIISSIVFGLILASFINLVIMRLKNADTFIFGRSKCDRCGHVLAVFDLIPLFSFLLSMGRCRYCKSNILIRHILVELVFGFVFGLLAMHFGYISVEFIYALSLVSLFIILSIYDIDDKAVPQYLTWATVITSIPAFYIFHIPVIDALYGMVFVFIFIGLQVLLTRGRGMGIGDAIIGLAIGLALGLYASIVAIMISYISASIVGLSLFAYDYSKYKKAPIPFIPFLAFGLFIAIIWGLDIADWYFYL